ncbi:MAG: hypothetical protein H7A24_17895 [Leptospiraceae bacterium]|nr:hypothetical protein [Leptospiraceae bacterium]
MKKLKWIPTALILIFSFWNCSQVDKDSERDFLANLGLFYKRTTQAEISGTAMKGAVSGARVQVLPLVNNACDRTGATAPLAESVTDPTGAYTIRFTKTGTPVCILVTPDSRGITQMYDETLKRNISWNSASYYLDSIIAEPGGLTSKGAINSPFSRMTSQVFAKTMQKADASFAQAVAASSSKQVVAMFGLNRGFIKTRNARNRSLTTGQTNPYHHKRFGNRSTPGGKNLNNTGRASGSVTPTLEQMNIDFSKPEDPLTAKFILVSSGISALANKLATTSTVSAAIRSGNLTRETANGDAIERVINGFSEVVESGGRKNTILKNVYKAATGKAPPASFTKDPLQATMQTGIASYVTEAGGGDEWGLSADEISNYFDMSSVPPADLWVDTASAPDYLYYADNNKEGAMLLYTNTFESYYPWVEGGLPTSYSISSGKLPAGMSLNPVTGEIFGIATNATTTNATLTIKAENVFGSTLTTFQIQVQNYVIGEKFAYVYYSECTQNSACTLEVGIEGIANYDYVITGFTSPGFLGTPAVTDSILGTITGTAANINGAKTGTVSYREGNGTTGTVPLDFWIDSNQPKVSVDYSYLVVGEPGDVFFWLEGVGDPGTYSFLAQDLGNGMRIDSSGWISGTPTTSGAWNPTIILIKSDGSQISLQLTGTNMIVNPAGTVIATDSAAFTGTIFYTDTTPNCPFNGSTSCTFEVNEAGLPPAFVGATYTDENQLLEAELSSYYSLSLASNGTITGSPSFDIFGEIKVTLSDGFTSEYVYVDIIGGGIDSGGGITPTTLTYADPACAASTSCTWNPSEVITGASDVDGALSPFELSIDDAGVISGTIVDSSVLGFVDATIEFTDIDGNLQSVLVSLSWSPAAPATGAYYLLTGTPDPSTVFNTIDRTFAFGNNLANSIWHGPTNKIVAGHFQNNGYYLLDFNLGGYGNLPDRDTSTMYSKMVIVPATSTVVHTTSGHGVAAVSDILVSQIDETTATLSGKLSATFSDSYTGGCFQLSSSATELLCYNSGVIRHYTTTNGSGLLTFVKTVTLSKALANTNNVAYGGTFAWDGMYYYFPTGSGTSANLGYEVYDASGTYVNTYTATGSGALNGLYFDWSAGRYSSHDGYGARTGGLEYWPSSFSGISDDSQSYTPVSSYHTLAP